MTFKSTVLQLAAAKAAERTAAHEGQASQRKLHEKYEEIGMVGEAAFALAFGAPIDFKSMKGGDDGYDFIIALKFKVDVKASPKPGNLLVEPDKIGADIYVLADYQDDPLDCKLLGWAWAHEVRAAPQRDFGAGFMSHYIPRADLRSMSDLGKRQARIE